MNRKTPGKEAQLDDLARRTVDLAFDRLRLDRPPSIGSIEGFIDVLDSGALDSVLADCSPACESGLPRRRYADSMEFSHDDWMRRHGLDR